MTFSNSRRSHQPVLYNEIIHALQPRRGGTYVDCTVGAGGHAFGIMQASGPDGRLLGLDVDPMALELARQRLAIFGPRVNLVRASYVTLRQQLDALGWKVVDGVVLDLGVSSMQLDHPERGFSFKEDAPLDMRFDPDGPIRAVDLVNGLPEAELADILFRYGEERHSRQVAHAIVSARPVRTTRQLADLVASQTGSGRPGMHPATRTFQALRIAVNQELESITMVLPQALASLASGGGLAVIAFHSLEDRIVKQFFQRESRDCICPPRQPVCTCGHRASIRVINRRPIRPGETEVHQNPRARSARLRVAYHL
jgi:16S rRNA (cytosine1402-N4)-methyltransferase